jgi:TorA maturation chaperone TorD
MSSKNEVENPKTEELASIFSLRAQVYSILRHFFLFEPSREYLHNLLQNKVLKVISEAYPEEDLRTSSQEFLRDVKELSDGGDEALVDTWAEYTRLFIGPSPPLAPPYESLQREAEGERRFKGETWINVKEWFLDDGFLLEDQKVLEDHAGIEFEYMQLTSINAVELIGKGDKESLRNLLMRQKRFLEEHLTKWIPKLCAEIEEKTKSPFYRSFAKFTRIFIKEDLSLLNEVLTYQI